MNNSDQNLPSIYQPSFSIDLSEAGKAANQAAARYRFLDYKQRRSEQTLRRQSADLQLFQSFLSSVKLEIDNLFQSPEAWQVITWGLVEAFIKWQLQQGYAIQSINVRLATIKAYARLALQSGFLSAQEYALIRSVRSYTQKEQRRIDQKRPITRLGLKKASPVTVTAEQANALKNQPKDTAHGRRDAVMMCLLLDHGLRVGEVRILSVDMFDLEKGLLRFYRPKVGKEQIHRLSADTLQACLSYKQSNDMPSQGPLLRCSLKSKDNNKLGKPGMTERAITQRVNLLGKVIGVFGLSAHDCRHYWATAAARHGTDPFILQEAGGWSSLAMPRRYIEVNEISNDGVILI